MAWFNGNPAHLWQYLPREEDERYIECFGGLPDLYNKASEFIECSDSRFATTLLRHAIAPTPDDERTKDLLATAYEDLGFGSENAIWRNSYLTGALMLRTGVEILGTDLSPALDSESPMADLFQILSVQLDGETASESDFAIQLDLGHDGMWRTIISNRALTYRGTDNVDPDTQGEAELKLVKSKEEFLGGMTGEVAGSYSYEGALEYWDGFFGLHFHWRGIGEAVALLRMRRSALILTSGSSRFGANNGPGPL